MGNFKFVRPFFTILVMTSAIISLFHSSNVAYARHFQVGDVFVTAGEYDFERRIEQHRPDIGLEDTYRALQEIGEVIPWTKMAFDHVGNLYAVSNYGSFGSSRISKFDHELNLLNDQLVYSADVALSDIVLDAYGNLYVSENGGDILKYDSDGNLVARYDVDAEAELIALAADQTTMYYSTGSQIKRYDFSSDNQLPDFATIPVPYYRDMTLLQDGGLLVSNGYDIKRLDATGAIIQAYDVPSEGPTPFNHWRALTLDVDSNAFWAADIVSGWVYKFDITSGDALDSFHPTGAGYQPYGVAVFVPEPATILLLASGLVWLVGFRRKFRNKQSI